MQNSIKMNSGSVLRVTYFEWISFINMDQNFVLNVSLCLIEQMLWNAIEKLGKKAMPFEMLDSKY